MSGVIRFIHTVIWIAIYLGTIGTLVKATNYIGKEAVKAHQSGGIKFKELSKQLHSPK